MCLFVSVVSLICLVETSITRHSVSSSSTDTGSVFPLFSSATAKLELPLNVGLWSTVQEVLGARESDENIASCVTLVLCFFNGWATWALAGRFRASTIWENRFTSCKILSLLFTPTSLFSIVLSCPLSWLIINPRVSTALWQFLDSVAKWANDVSVYLPVSVSDSLSAWCLQANNCTLSL